MSVAMWWSIYALAAAVTLGVILGVTKFERSCACTDGLCARCDELERAIKPLCTLVEQGERDRRDAARWRAFSARADMCSCGPHTGYYLSGDVTDEFNNKGVPGHDEYADALIAAMQPNDSAARTGQEG